MKKSRIPFYSISYVLIESVLTVIQTVIERVCWWLQDISEWCEYHLWYPELLEWWDERRFKTYLYTLRTTEHGNDTEHFVLFAKTERISNEARQMLFENKLVKGYGLNFFDVTYRLSSSRNGWQSVIANKLIENESENVFVATYKKKSNNKHVVTLKRRIDGKTWRKIFSD